LLLVVPDLLLMLPEDLEETLGILLFGLFGDDVLLLVFLLDLDLLLQALGCGLVVCLDLNQLSELLLVLDIASPDLFVLVR
jgi:hypothetical protein